MLLWNIKWQHDSCVKTFSSFWSDDDADKLLELRETQYEAKSRIYLHNIYEAL